MHGKKTLHLRTAAANQSVPELVFPMQLSLQLSPVAGIELLRSSAQDAGMCCRRKLVT